jgi:hypothetical protein
VASRIHTAVVSLRRHLENERKIAEGGDALPLSDWMALCEKSIKFKESCDRALVGLGLDKRVVKDVWDVVYNSQPAAITAPPSPPEGDRQGNDLAAGDRGLEAECGGPGEGAPGETKATPEG